MLLLLLPPASAQEKPPAKDLPRVLVANPLGVTPGATTKVTLRGLKLDTAGEVRIEGAKAVKLLSKGKASVPNNQQPNKVGDTQIELEITLPKEAAGDSIWLTVVTPAGTSPPYALILNGKAPLIAEKEPNNGFREAQPIQLAQDIDGQIDRPQDVDVYRFEGKAGQILLFEVEADRFGSALDPILLLHDADGRQLASNDDDALADPRLAYALKKDGVYFLTVMDAHDQGGPAHVYRLVARLIK
jgi:hypothetical protein